MTCSDLRTKTEKARDETVQFREREKAAHVELERLQEEEKLLVQKKKKGSGS